MPAWFGANITDATALLATSVRLVPGGAMTLISMPPRPQSAGWPGILALTRWICLGYRRFVNESMAAAMRSHVAERNRDPRNYTMFAFGGAGPVHAVAVARRSGSRK